MIHYQLRCDKNHEFEAWFKGSAGFDAQRRRGEVECPHCGTTQVAKAPMAPSLVGRAVPPAGGPITVSSRASKDAPLSGRAQEVAEAARKIRDYVEENCDYVGAAFPEEARRIHFEKDAARGIYGEATADEARALDDEGIEVFRLPRLPRRNG